MRMEVRYILRSNRIFPRSLLLGTCTLPMPRGRGGGWKYHACGISKSRPERLQGRNIFPKRLINFFKNKGILGLTDKRHKIQSETFKSCAELRGTRAYGANGPVFARVGTVTGREKVSKDRVHLCSAFPAMHRAFALSPPRPAFPHGEPVRPTQKRDAVAELVATSHALFSAPTLSLFSRPRLSPARSSLSACAILCTGVAQGLRKARDPSLARVLLWGEYGQVGNFQCALRYFDCCAI